MKPDSHITMQDALKYGRNLTKNILMNSLGVLGLVVIATFLHNMAPELRDEGGAPYFLVGLLSLLVYLLAIWEAIVLSISVCFKLIVDAQLTARTDELENAD